MATYTCVDGPLEGRTFHWRRPPSTGDATTVARLDVGHGILEVSYRLDSAAEGHRSGILRFVGARQETCVRGWRRQAVPLIH